MKRNKVDSTDIASIGFQQTHGIGDSIFGIMEVEFKRGRIYRYDGIPVQKYRAVLTSHSPGSVLYKLVTTQNYAYKEITGNDNTKEV